jgi:hypothetical protein
MPRSRCYMFLIIYWKSSTCRQVHGCCLLLPPNPVTMSGDQKNWIHFVLLICILFSMPLGWGVCWFHHLQVDRVLLFMGFMLHWDCYFFWEKVTNLRHNYCSYSQTTKLLVLLVWQFLPFFLYIYILPLFNWFQGLTNCSYCRMTISRWRSTSCHL